MIKRILFLFAVTLVLENASAQEIPLTQGMKISKTITIRKAVYKLDAPADTSNAVIIIEGNNIVLDFANIELRGSNQKSTPDEFFGVAILIRNSKNVKIINLKVRGYKVAILGRNVENLSIENCDLSYNYRPHLNSSQEKEDISDWMSYHQNEKDEWLRYGAAIYLRNCNYATISNCKVTGGQNALMMTECNNGRIYNNEFSFNSGIGMGMYRCNYNQVMFNKMNFNVRGYSHGVYNRGQDSAGMLVYEQCNYNVFYKNSATHSGDGFFLWAGQTTMNTGNGGCNDNVIWDNDFSYAPTNGIEVTFSRNHILGNRIFECDHGIWGGYSYNTTIHYNQFSNNRIGIAIEHGQENKIIGNTFHGNKEAIRLWARKQEPSDWGYAKYRDTRSRNYAIFNNSLNDNHLVFSLSMTDSLNVFGNTFYGRDKIFKIDSTVTHLDTTVDEELKRSIEMDTTMAIPSVLKPQDPFKDNESLEGRKNIMMTEWGPYDFRYPIIWNTNPTAKSDTLKFDLIGPVGNWKIFSTKGISSISKSSGTFPSIISVVKNKSVETDILIQVEYTGSAITTPFGELNPAGKPYLFYFKKFFQPINWEVNWFSLDTLNHHPLITGTLFSPLERKAPFKTERPDKLDYSWWGGIKEGSNQYRQFITVATAETSFTPGNYELSITWDDAVRVYIDEKLVIDEWNPSLYKFDESPNRRIKLKMGGKQNMRVEHMELGGFACLSLKFRPIP